MKCECPFKLLMLTPALLFSLLITPSYGQPPGMGPLPGLGMRAWKGDAKCWRALEMNLSQEQAKGFDAIQQAFLREVQVLRAQIFSKRLELRDLLTNPSAKTEAIRTKSSEISEHQTKLEEKSLDYLIKVRNLLTPEQLKSWCPEMELAPHRRMMQGPEYMGSPPRKPPAMEGGKQE